MSSDRPRAPGARPDVETSPTAVGRRAFVAGMLAPFVGSALASADVLAKGGDSHWHAGGIGGITRARYTVRRNTYLPLDDVVYLLPLDDKLYDEGTGLAFEQQQLTVTQDGLYRVYLVIDWPGQAHGRHPIVAKDLRYDGIRRIPIGESLEWEGPNKLTIVGEQFDKIGVTDIPGSDPPQYARSEAGTTWNPGTVPANGVVYVDVPLDTTGIVVPGDAAQAALSTITDGNLGLANELALDLSARVVVPNQVRVVLRNLSGSPVTVPNGGLLNVLAGSLTNVRGESADAWIAAQSSSEYLLAGEKIIGVWKSKMKGDYLQKSNMTFLQVERLATL